MRKVELDVDGMHCGGCVSRVESALGAVPGVESVEVSLDRGRAEVRADESAADDAFLRAVEEAGYSASLRS